MKLLKRASHSGSPDAFWSCVLSGKGICLHLGLAPCRKRFGNDSPGKWRHPLTCKTDALLFRLVVACSKRKDRRNKRRKRRRKKNGGHSLLVAFFGPHPTSPPSLQSTYSPMSGIVSFLSFSLYLFSLKRASSAFWLLWSSLICWAALANKMYRKHGYSPRFQNKTDILRLQMLLLHLNKVGGRQTTTDTNTHTQTGLRGKHRCVMSFHIIHHPLSLSDENRNVDQNGDWKQML